MTPKQIFKRSEYSRHRNDITLEMIMDKLSEKNSIIQDWLNYSEDKRWTPSWGIQKDEAAQYIVQYFDTKNKYSVVFNSPIIACAFMIRMEFEELNQPNE